MRFPKIQEFSRQKLNGAEYRNFFERFLSLTKRTVSDESDPPIEPEPENPDVVSADVEDPLGIPTELRTAAYEKLAALTDLVNESKGSLTTETLDVEDKTRENGVSYLFATVKQNLRSPFAPQMEAAKQLNFALKGYYDFARKPNQQQTALIDGMGTDLAKPGMDAYLEALHLTETMGVIVEANNRYKALLNQRTYEAPAVKAAKIKELRLEMDDLYDEMTTYAFAMSVLHPNDTNTAFITDLNKLITEVMNLYNQRIAQAQAAKRRKEESIPVMPTEPEA